MFTDHSPGTIGTEPLIIEGISYIPSSVLLVGIPKISFKDNQAFGVVDPQGESPRLYSQGSELGIYYQDTRHVGIWEMTFNGSAPVSLSHELRFGGNTAVFSMTNKDLPKISGGGRIRRDTFLIRRVLTLHQDVFYETVDIKNFDNESHSLQIEHWAGGRFDDVFEVRGYSRTKRGRMLPAQEVSDGSGRRVTLLQYEGLDGKIRKTYIYRLYSSEKIRVSPGIVGYFTRIEVPAKGSVALKSVVSFDQEADCKLLNKPYETLNISSKMNLLANEHDIAPHFPLKIEADNAILNRAIQNSTIDIYMLLTEVSPDVLYPYAGVPWFSAPFGRDGLISAYQMLPWHAELTAGVLGYVFKNLGKEVDPFSDEQPGKAFHEMRLGELSNIREVPFTTYYGSVDSTPLALILLHEYIRWSMDLERLKMWWPEAIRALAWIDRWAAPNLDGFLEYEKKSSTGLINQGWKDSHDSVMYSNGKLAQPPIRLCEVQGYGFRAKMGMSALAKLLGKDELSQRLRLEALQMKVKFVQKFWDAQRKYVYLALDGSDKPCDVISSNMGHCLWGQILMPDHAEEVVKHLMSDSLFSGFGIRTLADTETSYNPMSYHNGSVWPHDNSIIMEGMRYYGKTRELEALCLALMSVLESSDDFRLPELFCGFRKRGNSPPVPYETACKPQAWAAGAVFLMIKAMLGLSMEADQSYLVFNSPLLTPKINTLEIRGLHGRDWEIDLVLRRTRSGTLVDVTRKQGNVRVLTVK